MHLVNKFKPVHFVNKFKPVHFVHIFKAVHFVNRFKDVHFVNRFKALHFVNRFKAVHLCIHLFNNSTSSNLISFYNCKILLLIVTITKYYCLKNYKICNYVCTVFSNNNEYCCVLKYEVLNSNNWGRSQRINLLKILQNIF